MDNNRGLSPERGLQPHPASTSLVLPLGVQMDKVSPFQPRRYWIGVGLSLLIALSGFILVASGHVVGTLLIWMGGFQAGYAVCRIDLAKGHL